MANQQLPQGFGPTGTSVSSESSDTKTERALSDNQKLEEYLEPPPHSPNSNERIDLTLDWIHKQLHPVPVTKCETEEHANHSMAEPDDSYSTITTNFTRMTAGTDKLEKPISETLNSYSPALDIFPSSEEPRYHSDIHSTADPCVRLFSQQTSSLPKAYSSFSCICFIGQKEPRHKDAYVPASGRLSRGTANGGPLDSDNWPMPTLNSFIYPPPDHKTLDKCSPYMDPYDTAFDNPFELSNTGEDKCSRPPWDHYYNQDPPDFSSSHGGRELSPVFDESLAGFENLEYVNYHDHTLYQKDTPSSDGLYHCPWEGKDLSCSHRPDKLKCNYDKFVDSHLKPYRCKVRTCENARFSSTACLLRHEREAHAMHGHGEKPFLCTFPGCERGLPAHGFPRHWNLRDHMRRVHDADPSLTSSSKPAKSSRKRKSNAAFDIVNKRPSPSHQPMLLSPKEQLQFCRRQIEEQLSRLNICDPNDPTID